MVEKLRLKVHIAFALIGFLAGIAGGFIFIFGFGNFHAGESLIKKSIL
jgi:hypothetical protein